MKGSKATESIILIYGFDPLRIKGQIQLCRVLCRKGGVRVKRVKAACIFQTLVFSQKPELALDKDHALKLNFQEFEHYKTTLERTGTRYQIVDTAQQDDGTLVVRVRKQYNDKADVSEYFT